MKQPQMKSTKSLKRMTKKEWDEHIKQVFDLDLNYKGIALQDFDGWVTVDISRWLKSKEKEYAQAKMGGLDTEHIKAEIINAKQYLASRSVIL